MSAPAAAPPEKVPEAPAATTAEGATAPAAPAASPFGSVGADAGKAASAAANAVGDGFKNVGGQAMGVATWLYQNAASKLNSTIQFALVVAILIVIIIAEVQNLSNTSYFGCTELQVSSLAVAAALILLTVSTILDLFLAGKRTAGEGICTAVWRKLNVSLLGWGLLLAALAWQGYGLYGNGMYADQRSASPTLCAPSFWRPMAIVWWILALVFIVYTLLILVVSAVACCGGRVKPAPVARDDNGKPLPATALGNVAGLASSAWLFVLNFFGLDDLTSEPAPAAAAASAEHVAAPPTNDAEKALLAKA